MNFRRLRNQMQDFLRDTSGAFAMMFGLMAIVLFLIAGAAIDFSAAVSTRTKLSQALDSAALAIGASGNLSQEAAEDLAQDIFAANYPSDELGTPSTLTVTLNGQVISIKATASVDTAFLRVIGMDKLDVASEAEVTKDGKDLEIVMVLDNTGSMAGTKLASLKTAATTLVGIIFGDNETVDNAKIGLVPFAAAVNVGSSHSSDFWIDTGGLSSQNEENFSAGVSVWQLYQDLAASDVSWGGCVEARLNGYDTLDTVPNAGNPETLWVPYLWPDEPDNGEKNVGCNNCYPNNYLDDGNSLKKAYPDTRQRDTAKYSSGDSISGSGPNKSCPDSPILAMTNTKSTLTTAINNMSANYTTDIPVGLAWGWRVISPDEPFTEGVDYTDDDTIKAIILLTDGENVISSRNNHNDSDYTAYGYLSELNLGTTSSSAAESKLDDKTSELCDNIKDKDILIYTISFQVSSNSTKTMLKNCATTTSMYYDSPSESELQNTFSIIAKQLSNLRLSK